ncbi:hypothetical protein R3P38DRAFT_3493245 [Favolaschia claudopus]|uniref:Uncharacterized protein n=1 Tax=Favolaschia claudopus TaxID=2862362 RepID=A0AAW0CAR8_9AGAR
MPPAPNTPPTQENARRPWPPFRPRQPRADTPHFPGPRWNPRTAKFLAIRSKQPPLTSHAASARYRLGRKTATKPPHSSHPALFPPPHTSLATTYKIHSIILQFI